MHTVYMEEEDPSTKKTLQGRKTFRWIYKQKFRCVLRLSRDGIKDGGRQKQKRNLRPSVFFTGVNNYLSACGNAKQNGQRLSWFVARNRIFQAKAV